MRRRPRGTGARCGRGAAGLAAGLALLSAACGPPPEPRTAPDPEEARGEAAPAGETPPEPEEAGPGERRPRTVSPGGARGLPEIPRRVGPLALRVQYPERGWRLAVRDSNFIFGTVGTGDATLEIDGHPVPVEPNGAFLAFLPVPRSMGETAVYRLVARRGGTADTLLHRVRLPPLPHVGPEGTVWLDSAALAPSVERWALPEEWVDLAVRGAPGLEAWAEVGERRFPLREGRDPARRALETAPWPAGRSPASRSYRARVPAGKLAEAAGRGPGRPVLARREAPAGIGPEAGETALALATPDTLTLALVGTDGRDTVRLERRLPLLVLEAEGLPVVALRDRDDPVHGASGAVEGRPRPEGPYLWHFPPGARARVDGRWADRLRLRLAPHEAVWIQAEEAEPLPEETPSPAGRAGDIEVTARPDRLVVEVPLEIPLPAQVTRPAPGALELTIYGATGGTDRIAYGASDPLLESVAWEQVSEEVYRVRLRLRAPVWGHRVGYRMHAGERDDASLRLEVRRPPSLDRRSPLRDRRVAVDPGHPVGGAYGPTGLFEGDVNLAVARRLVELLRAEGADPVLVRRDTLPMGLYERTLRAVEAGAELFVSIHANALPDGVRPFGREGTSTYYHHPHARELAEAVQAGMVAEMGLRDLGVFWGDLAVTRLSWMPSVLAEGAFVMVPRHEAALRRPEFQERYAMGVLNGIRAFLAGRAEPTVGLPGEGREARERRTR